ncbi:phosphoadenosine phosphosulfate reductase family protein [Parendozoicomonas sp. Alg238-R29]|uniref:phosphoadenosine phosphosulfate reductase domain-containing protein n=1 Tax=Parendozoicomonas sp. Alg238-R29 TaxID=2993446 RepID=UPI00248D8E45|nr:phosphoadenosine phosphosulfate reductase family protein [Parendozoicomonas sp. Alg238-R29]
MTQSLQEQSASLKGKSPEDIIQAVLADAKNPVITTNFGPHEAAILHLAVQQKPDIPVIWIDSGYGTAATYKFAQQLIRSLKLNIYVYHPKYSRAYREAVHGGIPEVDTPEHDAFTQEVKLEPFNRAMKEYAPDVWLTAIRQEQTAFRQNLDILTETQDGLLRVAPLFYWTELDLEEYLVENDLPIEEDYFDPTKVLGNRECGLHTTR